MTTAPAPADTPPDRGALRGAGSPPPQEDERPDDRGRTAWIVGLAVVTVLAPVLAAPWRWMAGTAHVDAHGTAWFYAFTARALREGRTLAHTELLFFPWGKDVWRHTGGNLVDAVLAAPLTSTLGPVAGYNLWVACVLAANAYGGLRMADALGGAEPTGAPRAWRWTAAVAMAWNPYALMELGQGRPTQALLVFAALASAALWRLGRESGVPGRWRDAVACGGWLALTGLTYWFHGLVLGVCAVVYGGVRVATGLDRAAVAGRLAVAALVCAAGVAPFVGPMLRSVGTGEVPGLLALDGTGPLAPLALRTVEGDAEGLWILAPGRGFASGALIDDGGLQFVEGATVVLGAQALIVAAGLWRARRAWAAAWLVVAIGLACGPALIVGDTIVASAPYLWLVEHAPFLRRWWWPGRAVAMAQLLAAALVPLACVSVPARVRAWLVGAVGALYVTQLVRAELLPLPRWDAAPSPVLDCLAEAPPGAVIDVPGDTDQAPLFLQTRHHKPILSGMLVTKGAFVPPEWTALREGNALLRALDDIGDRRWGTASAAVPAEARAALLDLGYRYVLGRAEGFRRPTADGAWEADWARPRRLIEATLGGPPFAEDARYAMWDLRGEAGCGSGPATPTAAPPSR